MRYLLPVLLLAGCGQGADADRQAQASPAPAANGTDYVATLRDMNPDLRRATFLRAIRDAGQACQQVTEDRSAGTANGQATWGVRCEDGRGWLIAIAPNGDAKVTGPVARE